MRNEKEIRNVLRGYAASLYTGITVNEKSPCEEWAEGYFKAARKWAMDKLLHHGVDTEEAESILNELATKYTAEELLDMASKG